MSSSDLCSNPLWFPTREFSCFGMSGWSTGSLHGIFDQTTSRADGSTSETSDSSNFVPTSHLRCKWMLLSNQFSLCVVCEHTTWHPSGSVWGADDASMEWDAPSSSRESCSTSLQIYSPMPSVASCSGVSIVVAVPHKVDSSNSAVSNHISSLLPLPLCVICNGRQNVVIMYNNRGL